MTQSAMAGAAGIRPRLLRPPVLGDAAAVGAAAEARARGARAGRLPDRARQHRRRGLAPPGRRRRSSATPTPAGERRRVVLMHDGGGDRSETVAALDESCPSCAGEGYTFVGPCRRCVGTARRAQQPRPPAAASACAGGAARGLARLAPLLAGALHASCWSRSRSWRCCGLLVVVVSPAATRAGCAAGAEPRTASHRRSRSSSPPTTRRRASSAPSARWPASDYPDLEVDRRRRRLDRRHRGRSSRRSALPSVRLDPPGQRAARPAALNTGIARRRARRSSSWSTATPSSSPTRIRQLVQPLRRPDGRRGRRQHQGRQPRRPARPLAAHRVRHRLQPRPPHVRRARSACRPCPARSAPSAARRSPRSAACQRDTLAEDTDLTHGDRPGRLAGRLRGGAPRLDRGARDARGSCGGSATAGRYGTMQAIWKHRARCSRASAPARIGRRRRCPT